MNKLEKEILLWIGETYPDEMLSDLIPSLKVVEREYTGSGVFVSFVHNKREGRSKSYHLIGPLIRSSNLEFGAETTLSVKNGSVDCLEILVIGSGAIEGVCSYELVKQEINFIVDKGV